MSELDWTGAGPRSTRFDDVYFQLEDGLAESRAVFLAGADLPGRFAGRRRFCVGELGFGTGLNILALLDLWRRFRPFPEARLHMVSIEAYPITADEAARALSAFPELTELAADLLEGWPDGRRGAHRIDFPALGASLDLIISQVEPALDGLEARMDAWFLDGFAPSKNPDMWSERVLSRIGALSAPGCIAATFTVAGDVRRRLTAAGFEVSRQSGFGRKRQRLEARWPGHACDPPSPSTVAVVGAGVAGASLVRALREQGVGATLFDASGVGAGASGNPSALITPRLDAGLGPGARLHVQAFARAIQLIRTEAPASLVARGAVQLEAGPRDASRFERISQWDGFAPGAVQTLTPEAVSQRLKSQVSVGALRMRDALVAEPMSILTAFLDGEAPQRARVGGVSPSAEGWRLTDADGAELGVYDAVCIAAGPAATALVPSVPLRPVRGQVTMSAERLAGEAASWGGYVIAARKGLLFGATHQRYDADPAPRHEDDAANLASLATVSPDLAARVGAGRLTHRASVRAAVADNQPVAGQVSPGLYILSGLGGRGYTLAPLLAENIAAELVGAPQPLAADLARLVHPARLAAREQMTSTRSGDADPS